MMSLRERYRYSDFYRIFNLKDPLAKGRSVLLANTFLSSIANIFISGVFYTGFLTVNGIDIVRVGIIAFIPYIAWALSLFSPVVLSRFKRRRGMLLFNHVFYYVCVVLATTVIPMFVTGDAQRTLWFGVFIFIGNAVNAILGSGATAWHIHFLPDGQDRNSYFSYTNMISSFVGTLVAILSSVAADSLAGSPQQGEIITILRFVAVGLFVIIGLITYLIPQEFPYPAAQGKVGVADIITVPMRAKKFLLTATIMMLWNAICNVNGSTWSYYVLNTVGISYTYMYIGSCVNALCYVFMMRFWRRMLNEHQWLSMLFTMVLITGLLEFPIAFSTHSTQWIYVVVSIVQGFFSVGTGLVFANMFYINLPKGNTDIYVTFWNFTANISVLVGSVLGTWFLAATEPHGPWTLFGLPFYGSQFLVWIKFVLLIATCVYIRKITPRIQPDT